MARLNWKQGAVLWFVTILALMGGGLSVYVASLSAEDLTRNLAVYMGMSGLLLATVTHVGIRWTLLGYVSAASADTKLRERGSRRCIDCGDCVTQITTSHEDPWIGSVNHGYGYGGNEDTPYAGLLSWMSVWRGRAGAIHTLTFGCVSNQRDAVSRVVGPLTEGRGELADSVQFAAYSPKECASGMFTYGAIVPRDNLGNQLKELYPEIDTARRNLEMASGLLSALGEFADEVLVPDSDAGLSEGWIENRVASLSEKYGAFLMEMGGPRSRTPSSMVRQMLSEAVGRRVKGIPLDTTI